MGKSKKDLKRQKQRTDREQGITAPEKKPPMTEAACTLCKKSLRTTKRNVELFTHVQTYHSGSTVEACFPGQKYIP
ncbi:hypothetical protein QOT17_000704 [Balamuthia mandrillaris]